MSKKISFVNRYKNHHITDNKIMDSIRHIVNKQHFIGGQFVSGIEHQLADIAKSQHCVTCGNGTDALKIAISIESKGSKNIVFCPSYTFEATIQSILATGAIPWFVDCDINTFNICPKSLKLCIEHSKSEGYTLGGVVSVDIFGNPCDFGSLSSICRENNLWLVGDCAQSFGATFLGHSIGNYCASFITSFYPTKPLGGLGDGGAYFSNLSIKAKQVSSLKSHENIQIEGKTLYAQNSRLDAINAAYLSQKCNPFKEEICLRRTIFSLLKESVYKRVNVQEETHRGDASWCNFSFRCESVDDAEKIHRRFEENNIDCRYYYSENLHLNPYYSMFNRGEMNVTETLSKTVLSVPLHGNLDEDELETYRSCIYG